MSQHDKLVMNSLDAYLKKPIKTYFKCKELEDQATIRQIEELTKKGQEAENNEDLDGQKFYLKSIISKIEKLSPEMKDKFSKGSLIMHLNIARLSINDHQYKEAIDHIETAMTMQEYEDLEAIKKCIFNRYLSISKLYLGLNCGSKNLIFEAKEINQKLIKNAGKITSGELKKDVLNDKKIIESWKRDDIKTVIEFEIPFPLIVADHPIEFEYGGIKHIIEIGIIQSPLTPIPSKGWFAEIIEDKYGLAHRSKIKLTFFKYINPHEMVELNILAHDNRIQKIFLETIKVMNFFIERYRITSKKYWLENIFHKMITKYLCRVTAGTFQIHHVNVMNNQLIRVQFGIPWLSKEKLEEFQDNLRKDKLNLWESLLLDAKDYLLRRNYREAIYTINGAFENYLMLKAREILIKAWGEEKAITYLEGIPKYKYYKLNGYMNEESFDKAVNDGKIGKEVPPTGQILKECYKLHPLEISRNQLNKLVKKIRKNRNELVHGNDEINDDLETIAFEAIQSFEDFAKLF